MPRCLTRVLMASSTLTYKRSSFPWRLRSTIFKRSRLPTLGATTNGDTKGRSPLTGEVAYGAAISRRRASTSCCVASSPLGPNSVANSPKPVPGIAVACRAGETVPFGASGFLLPLFGCGSAALGISWRRPAFFAPGVWPPRKTRNEDPPRHPGPVPPGGLADSPGVPGANAQRYGPCGTKTTPPRGQRVGGLADWPGHGARAAALAVICFLPRLTCSFIMRACRSPRRRSSCRIGPTSRPIAPPSCFVRGLPI
jgi:hypothetical protein